MPADNFTPKDREDYGALKSTVRGHESWIKSLDEKLDGIVEVTTETKTKVSFIADQQKAINALLQSPPVDRRSPVRKAKTFGVLGGTAIGGGAAFAIFRDYVLPAVRSFFGG